MTNFVTQAYEYFVDLKTSATSMQVIQITAGGQMPQIRLAPFFGAFKQFKLGRVSIRLVPAATLPVDPTGLSYAAGENTVDPRDQFNPGLIRITNGEDVSDLASLLIGTSAEQSYYATLLDRRWFKFALQAGCKRSAIPLVWRVGQSHQSIRQALTVPTTEADLGVSPTNIGTLTALATGALDGSQGWENALMQVDRCRLGWMPTDMFNNHRFGINTVPEIDVLTIILPKAYKTVYYYRMYIREEVQFKDAVAINPYISTEELSGAVCSGAIDRFVYNQIPGTTRADVPTSTVVPSTAPVNPVNGGTKVIEP